MPGRDPIGSFTVNSNGVQDSSLIRVKLCVMPAKQFFLGCLVLTTCGFAQSPQFTIQDLGALPNYPACTATGLSQAGNVTGYCVGNLGVSLITGPTTHGFLFSKGVITDLNLTSGPTPVPMAVNDSGVVTGGFLTINISQAGGNFSAAPFIVPQGSVATLPVGAMEGVLPFGLNNAGELAGSRLQVSGGSLNIFINSEAVLYPVAGGTATILAAPADTGTGAAFGLSSNGTVAGASIASSGSGVVPVLWQNSKAQALPILSGYPQSAATSANDSGVAAGVAFSISFDELIDPNAAAHAVRFNADGSVADLGVVGSDKSSIATGINNSGWVVGFSSSDAPNFALQLAPILFPPASNYRAFLYANGTMYDLNTLLVKGTGWSLAYATAINNAGQIAGTGIFQGPNGAEQHGFLLTPVAASPTPSITGIGGAGGSVPAVTSISPNGLISIYGSNLASAIVGVTSADIVNNELPTTLGGTCVEGGGTSWGLFFVSPGQINALAGDLPASGNVAVSVITNCGTANQTTSPEVGVAVSAAAPEFLSFIQNANGQDPIAAVDYTTGIDVGTPGLITGGTFAPVHAGDIVVAYGVGWGPTTSTVPIGTLATGSATLTSPYSLTLGGISATVSYAGLAPSFAGLYQLNFTVPEGVSAGNEPLVLTVNGTPTPPSAFITVGN